MVKWREPGQRSTRVAVERVKDSEWGQRLSEKTGEWINNIVSRGCRTEKEQW